MQNVLQCLKLSHIINPNISMNGTVFRSDRGHNHCNNFMTIFSQGFPKDPFWNPYSLQHYQLLTLWFYTEWPFGTQCLSLLIMYLMNDSCASLHLF